MKILCTSDWHMSIDGDPSDGLCCSNIKILSLLRYWEEKYDLILLNGDILETLKSKRIYFSKEKFARRVLEDRKEIVEKFANNKKYIWIAGNHDYILGKVLGLPTEIKCEIGNGFMLVAEHGHLIRGTAEQYSDYQFRYHLMYCLNWWADFIGRRFVSDFSIDEWLHRKLTEYWRDEKKEDQKKKKLDSLLCKLACKFSNPKDMLESDQLPGLMRQIAKKQCQSSKTLVVYGHTHCPEIYDLQNGNRYINLGSFNKRNNYTALAFDTDKNTVKFLEHISYLS